MTRAAQDKGMGKDTGKWSVDMCLLGRREELQRQTHPASSARTLVWVPNAGKVTKFDLP